MVVVAQPRNLWSKVQERFRFPFERSKHALRAFPLVSRLCGIKGVCAKVRLRESRLRVNTVVRRIKASLPEGLSSFEIPIAHCAIRALIARTQTRGEVVAIGILLSQQSAQFRLRSSVRSSSGTSIERGASLACHNVDGTRESLCAQHARSCAFEHFDALNVGKVEGKIGRVVARLWIVDGDAVDKNSDLVKGSAIDADVGLHTEGTALTHIDSCTEFERVVDTCDTRRREFCAAKGHHLSCCLVSSKGSARSRGDHFA